MIVNVKQVTGNTYDIKIYRGKTNGGYGLSCSQHRNMPNPISNGHLLKINFCTLTYAETHQICTLRLNLNYFNRKGRKDYAKDARNLFLEVPKRYPSVSLV